ncbi:hypothetical protein quinque_004889 [Culex quinquefasciatus]
MLPRNRFRNRLPTPTFRYERPYTSSDYGGDYYDDYYEHYKQAETATEQTNTDQQLQAVVDPECLIKHPLQFTWTLWYQEMDRSKNWEDTLNEVTSFSTVEDFWSLYNHIKSPSDIKAGSDYSLFKTGVRPMWEDEGQQAGRPILCLIGEAFECADEICGAVVNVRPKGDKIAIWTANFNNRDAVLSIGRIYKERLGLKFPITYHLHKDTMVKSGSSVKAAFTV